MAERTRKKKSTAPNLTSELAALLEKEILPDLNRRAQDVEVSAALRTRYIEERSARRTGDSLEEWTANLLEQVGAAWILSCVFVRTLEDRELLGRKLAGPGAKDAEQLFFELFPALGVREYLLASFREVSRLPGGDLLGPEHNLAFRLGLSEPVARQLLGFFQRTEDDGSLRFWFGGGDTRFLGDLYQDLSASVRERYALLQTPRFVEEFILDLTLEPAVKEFGLGEVRVLDPTCGSGHFVLGAFERLCEQRQRQSPGLDCKEVALLALRQVYGVDINPYAVAIARFRLTLAYLQRAGMKRLGQAPRLPLNLVVADSLLHGARGQQRLLGEAAETAEGRRLFGAELFELEDVAEARRVFGQGYHAVVGNPPYITCKDAALRELYRERYESAAGKYALAAPFTECFFKLAVDGGFVGLINANSFMKREFGKKLVEQVLPRYDLTRVIDTSGAFIPGHGTPTVLLFGRNRRPLNDKIFAVLGKRGEPGIPDDPEQGRVWSSIAAHFDQTGYEDENVSVVEVQRSTFERHPWSTGGGGMNDLKELIERNNKDTLTDRADSIGITSFTLEDDVYTGPLDNFQRQGFRDSFIRMMVIGEAIRDWALGDCPWAVFPYDAQLKPSTNENVIHFLWSYRTNLANNILFGGKTKIQGGLQWFEYGRLTAHKLQTPLSIAYAFVSTHNHFVLDRGDKVFNRTAPIIKLAEGADEDEHLVLLGYLNSSTACFSIKQSCFDRGSRGQGGGLTAEGWERFYEHPATQIGSLPIPRITHAQREEMITRSRSLLELGDARQEQMNLAPLFADASSLKQAIADRQQRIQDIEHQMRAQQESLDWWIYAILGLAPIELAANQDRIEPGARASDVRFAREVLAGATGRRYFELCRLPQPEQLATQPWIDRWHLQRRLDAIDASPWLRILETPVYKRTFREGFRPLDPTAQAREWLLARCEQELRHDRAIGTIRQLAHRLAADRPVEAVVEACLGQTSLEDVLGKLIPTDAVPYLAALRYSDTGLDKRARWEGVWDLQRREDRGETVQIEPPPKYDTADFRDQSFWRLRGKLDVPKERFISYPGAERDDDRSPLIGWAGWDHAQRARALAALYEERKAEYGPDPQRLCPLLAGVLELCPWLLQWHNQPDPDFDGERLGAFFERYVDTEARALGLGREQLRAWRLVPQQKKRKPRATARAKEE